MAEDKDTGLDEDVEGHTFTKTPDEGKKDTPGVLIEKSGDEEDVEGHMYTELLTDKTGEQGKKGSPGVLTDD